MKWLVALVVLCSCIILASAYESCYNPNSDIYFDCSYRCCTGYYYGTCCVTVAGAYWYAWLVVTGFFLVCVCACAGCGYGYRRRYIVRHRHINTNPVPAPVVVTTANTNGYQQFGGNQYKGYEAPPPPYNNPNY